MDGLKPVPFKAELFVPHAWMRSSMVAKVGML